MTTLWQDANFIWVVTGTILLGISAASIGGMAVLRQRALIGDVLAHAALPGIMVAFILFESTQPGLVVSAALFSSLLGYYAINFMTQKSKIKTDTAMAIVLSLFFALGLMLLSYIQASPLENKTGLDKLLFGQAAAMTSQEVKGLITITLIALTYLVVSFQKLRLISFDPIFAKSLGLKVKFYELSFALVLVLTIVVGLQIVGVILMAAALLIPISIARFWSSSLPRLLWIAALFAAVSAVFSTQLSMHWPNMPTGPWMVVILGLFFGLSWMIRLLRSRFYSSVTKSHV
ncbi:metal ABC transporter permease [Thiomicrospira microaerophila]|uniref:metal ABC transporter permease n=1 Tax=Thiomicrospira microaerophila TaxID=406020 RepID=UPI00200C5306|nr:iron chelate uptake ABC transporter family permease subunit [Thiomicrospira microaerophila]UQB41292.1 metal ABC transporter permease [Thiomicrospira microaerophila]